MAYAAGAGAYRTLAEPGDVAADATTVGGWVARVAPFAAPFVRDVAGAAGPGADAREQVPSVAAAGWRARAAQQAAGIPAAGRSQTRKTLVLWMLLIAMFLTIWQFLTPTERTPRPHADPRSEPAQLLEDEDTEAPADESVPEAPVRPDADADGGGLGVLVLTGIAPLAIVIGLFVLLLARGNRNAEALEAVEADLALGRAEGAAARLHGVAERWRQDMFSGSKALLLAAGLAERRADFAACLATCDTALARLASAKNGIEAMAPTHVVAALLAQRAAAVAALGRADEAEDELGAIRAEFPSFAGLAAAEVRVRLLAAVARRDRARAQEIARARPPTLALSLRDEMLARLVLAAGEGATSRADRAWLEGELGASAELCAWIDAIDPRLRADALAGSA